MGLKTRAELTVLRAYIENQAILEPILFNRASKCKQTKEQSSEDCLQTHFFTFLCDCRISFFCQDANKTGSNCAIIGCNLSKKHKLAQYKTQSGEPNYVDHKFLFNILLGVTCTKTWEHISKYYRACYQAGACIVWF